MQAGAFSFAAELRNVGTRDECATCTGKHDSLDVVVGQSGVDTVIQPLAYAGGQRVNGRIVDGH